MKNYELMEILSELPAGAEVEINCICTNNEIATSELDRNYVVRPINNVDYDDKIMVS